MDPKYTVQLDRSVGRWVYPLHRRLYELTDGRLGHRSFLGPILLLTTTGRRSGTPRTTPLLYMPDDGGFWVVGSNGGRDRTPGWVHNLESKPEAEVQAGREHVGVEASVLRDEDRDEVWPRLTEFYGGWSYYQQLTDRQLPAVRLRRRS